MPVYDDGGVYDQPIGYDSAASSSGFSSPGNIQIRITRVAVPAWAAHFYSSTCDLAPACCSDCVPPNCYPFIPDCPACLTDIDPCPPAGFPLPWTCAQFAQTCKDAYVSYWITGVTTLYDIGRRPPDPEWIWSDYFVEVGCDRPDPPPDPDGIPPRFMVEFTRVKFPPGSRIVDEYCVTIDDTGDCTPCSPI